MVTLQFLPIGVSLTVKDGGNTFVALRIFGGCDFFNYWESCFGRLNIRTLLHILFDTNNERSAISISIDSREEDSNKEYNPDEPNCNF
ncbi:hypothetical protein SLEP1_g22452 [Rubroshorea leprosula]|uniref:Uncharacterized protein n=1 Tax=Rubroshorea leprosula TaxID=152421 RepID=A0AAV5J986_9ROSI|nr:hypothetical protein SLEP1_g22452 [Rubroshorea leprosula]